jgi:hypothetical protein
MTHHLIYQNRLALTQSGNRLLRIGGARTMPAQIGMGARRASPGSSPIEFRAPRPCARTFVFGRCASACWNSLALWSLKREIV